MIKADFPNFKLKMVEKVEMPESVLNKEKGVFEKTGRKISNFGYTFISNDGNKEKLYFISPNDYSKLEDKNVTLSLKVTHNSYTKKNSVSLEAVIPA